MYIYIYIYIYINYEINLSREILIIVLIWTLLFSEVIHVYMHFLINYKFDRYRISISNQISMLMSALIINIKICCTRKFPTFSRATFTLWNEKRKSERSFILNSRFRNFIDETSCNIYQRFPGFSLVVATLDLRDTRHASPLRSRWSFAFLDSKGNHTPPLVSLILRNIWFLPVDRGNILQKRPPGLNKCSV